MKAMEPLYTAVSVQPAYQLRWSLAIFSKQELPPTDVWLDDLKSAVARDEVKILEVHARPPQVWQFYVSTTPAVAPPAIVRSIKGRLQHRLRGTNPDCFRRNFQLSAVGDARREVVESYVAAQLGHHRMADPQVDAAFERFQFTFPDVDLGNRQHSSHGVYIYNLHVVLVNEGRWSEVRESELAKTGNMVKRVADRKKHRLSRLSLLADHIHFTAAIPPDQSPTDVALAYMNNVAYAHGMKAVFRPSFYVGTIGEYDTGAIWNTLQ